MSGTVNSRYSPDTQPDTLLAVTLTHPPLSPLIVTSSALGRVPIKLLALKLPGILLTFRELAVTVPLLTGKVLSTRYSAAPVGFVVLLG